MSKKLEQETVDAQELRTSDGHTVAVTDNLVEIRAASGQVEVRIKLTADGPVLQMEAARLELKASEAVAIESKRLEITTTEEVKVDAKGDVRITGAMIYLN